MAKKKKSAKNQASETETAKAVKRRKPKGADRNTQKPIAGMEDLRDEELEGASRELLRAKSRVESSKALYNSAYEASKELMIEKKISVYKCEDVNFDLMLEKKAAQVKLKERKHSD